MKSKDKQVKLRKLIEKYKGVCQQCGIQTKQSDYIVIKFNSDGSECRQLGDSYPTIEHITPLALGGTNTQDNMTLLCNKCNWENSVIVSRFCNGELSGMNRVRRNEYR